MYADVEGALEYLKTHPYHNLHFTHRGEKMTYFQVKKVLEYAKDKGYESTEELTDEEVDKIISE